MRFHLLFKRKTDLEQLSVLEFAFECVCTNYLFTYPTVRLEFCLAYFIISILLGSRAQFQSSLSLSSEQQPKVRGWLLASLDGQTTGLIPANYVKILGKRRGRKTVESSKILKQQQSFTSPTLINGVTTASSLDEQEAAFESVFVETNKAPGAPDSTGKNGEKQDL